MPYINVKITKDHAATPEQKEEIIRGMTRVLAETLHMSPASTVVTIDEVPVENWGIGGDPVMVAREKAKARKAKEEK
jgi:4-oxalocrotonate tautomerase